MDKLINIKDLQLGMVIVRITRQNGPIKIRKSGLVSSPEMITGLTEMGVQEVEIDPEKTVEIDAPVSVNIHTKSQTLQLLESDRRSTHSLDDGPSDQFNRSLFLPSVQEIPSLWQYYAGGYITAFLIILGGFCIGWSTATYQQWMPAFQSPLKQIEPITQVLQTESPVPKVAEKSTADMTAQSKVDVLQEQAAIDDEKVSDDTKIAQPVIALKENKPASTPVLTSEPGISPELLKRFEQAINQLDSEPKDENQGRLETKSNILRIDQLPAWVMTELPGMAFSAHMYASNRADRWVRVNGTRMVEGDKIDDRVRIQKIDQQHVILSYEGYEFSMAALTDW
ncbi:MAG: general secretion pathway protein B [Paraglaciecola sp.]